MTFGPRQSCGGGARDGRWVANLRGCRRHRAQADGLGVLAAIAAAGAVLALLHMVLSMLEASG